MKTNITKRTKEYTPEEIKSRLSNIGEAIGNIALDYIINLEKKNADLEQQIEKMKCCENCKFKDCNKSSNYQTCWYCKNKNKWQLRR